MRKAPDAEQMLGQLTGARVSDGTDKSRDYVGHLVSMMTLICVIVVIPNKRARIHSRMGAQPPLLPIPAPVLEGSWNLITNDDCTYNPLKPLKYPSIVILWLSVHLLCGGG